MIKTIISDLGNVVVSFDHPKTAEKLRAVTERTSDKLFAETISPDLVHEYNFGLITTVGSFNSVNRELGSNMSFDYFSDVWNSTFGPEPILSEHFLESLSERYRLLALSDINELHFDFLEKNFLILDHFDDFILSFEVCSSKPSTAIFESALAIAGCSPDECLFIDDMEPNVEAARSIGINAVHFLSAPQLEADLKVRNVFPHQGDLRRILYF